MSVTDLRTVARIHGWVPMLDGSKFDWIDDSFTKGGVMGIISFQDAVALMPSVDNKSMPSCFSIKSPVTGNIRTFKHAGTYLARMCYISEDETIHVNIALDHPSKIFSLKGKTVVFTGALDSMTRQAAAELLTKAGGIPGNNITHATDYVVVGANAGSKLAKANSMQIPALSEQQFLDAVK